MKLSLFNYNLPEALIAQNPASPRDHSRLLVYDRKKEKIIHDNFFNLPKYLSSDDILVFNDSKVFPARLKGKKKTGGKAEILLLKEFSGGDWECLVGAKKPKIGTIILFKNKLSAEIISKNENKSWNVKFNFSGNELKKIIYKIGEMPLPPYIDSKSKKSNLQKQYQTIYAKKTGSAAAPTAGLHFTERLMKKIKKTGCQTEFVTLHVGLGTFNPVNTENIEDYQIHKEWVSVDKNTIKKLLLAKKSGKRIVAVGTTSVRTLESLFSEKPDVNKNFEKNVDIFIYPGYKFKFVDAMITNFHLPKSSLLMLVSAFTGREQISKLYKKAIKLKYRFFSFGDAMFLQ
ncbi:tRNA preQ1(34) S-adenosylmethionine ribosyltransferase-isomerase QueA [Patescibacteria group bacterium]|nr:tRNA preQ1(34) S-adenosylmethionine ribosyltransferase-isomerase QueA [Patescibacteria group bacterium]